MASWLPVTSSHQSVRGRSPHTGNSPSRHNCPRPHAPGELPLCLVHPLQANRPKQRSKRRRGMV